MAAIHPVTMPKWGIEMTQGTLNQWSVTEGAQITKGDPLLEVETDKIVNTVESPASGQLRRIIATTGETLPVGTLLAVLAEPGVSDAEINSFIGSFKGAVISYEPESADSPANSSSAPDAVTGTSAGSASGAPSETAAEDLRVSPIARRVAQTLGVDLSKVTGTGRNGRISKEDVENYARLLAGSSAGSGSASGGAAGPAAGPAGAVGIAGDPPPGNEPVIIKMSAMRSTIAKRLLESKQSIPHYRVSMDVAVDALMSRRHGLASSLGRKISLNDMLVRAVALALVKNPALNSQFDGAEIRRFPHADIAIAVATEGGLVTPIIRNADRKSIGDISTAAASLADRARSGTLTREEITGGTFTISNLGMFGVDRFDAIINPPQVAILAVGAATEKVVVRDRSPALGWIMTLTLSADHRVVDGAQSGAFLATLRDLMQAPEVL